MKKGLVSVSFRNNTPEQIVKAMKECALDCIEWGSDVHAVCDDFDNLAYIRRLSEESGVKISSYGSYYRLGKDTADDIDRYLDAAKALGTDTVRIWAGVKSFSLYTDDELEEIARDAVIIAEKAEKKGVVICLERHNGTITDIAEGAEWLMKRVDSKSFAMYWQPCQFNSEEFNIDYAKRLAEYTRVIHVFNWRGKEKYPLSEAIDIWKKYLACFSDDVVCLLEFMPDGRLESLEAEATALDAICS